MEKDTCVIWIKCSCTRGDVKIWPFPFSLESGSALFCFLVLFLSRRHHYIILLLPMMASNFVGSFRVIFVLYFQQNSFFLVLVSSFCFSHERCNYKHCSGRPMETYRKGETMKLPSVTSQHSPWNIHTHAAYSDIIGDVFVSYIGIECVYYIYILFYIHIGVLYELMCSRIIRQKKKKKEKNFRAL